jgi:hypothetical protein
MLRGDVERVLVASSVPDRAFGALEGWTARDFGSQIAYRMIGDGPVDVVVFSVTMIPFELMWDEPRALHFRTA